MFNVAMHQCETVNVFELTMAGSKGETCVLNLGNLINSTPKITQAEVHMYYYYYPLFWAIPCQHLGCAPQHVMDFFLFKCGGR